LFINFIAAGRNYMRIYLLWGLILSMVSPFGLAYSLTLDSNSKNSQDYLCFLQITHLIFFYFS